jgi:hypothetical protein
MQPRYDEMVLPRELTSQTGFEFLRVGLVEHDLQIVLQSCFDNPADWGAAAVEILQFAAKAYERAGSIDAEAAYGKMVDMFMQMVMKPVEGVISTPVGGH